MAQAYLRNAEGYCFPLSQKITTIGREGCDIIIQSPTIDTQHAIVEFNSNEGHYFLTDLNSLHGTYVNDVKVHNSSVTLYQNDVIQFGLKGHPYELYICSSPLVTCSEIRPLKKTAWNQSTRKNSMEPPFSLPTTLPQLFVGSSYQTRPPVPMTSWSTLADNSSNGFTGRPVTASVTPSSRQSLFLVPQGRFLQKRASDSFRWPMVDTISTATQTTLNGHPVQDVDGHATSSSVYNHKELSTTNTTTTTTTQELLNTSFTIHPSMDHIFSNKNNNCFIQNNTTNYSNNNNNNNKEVKDYNDERESRDRREFTDHSKQEYIEKKDKSELKEEEITGLQVKFRPSPSTSPYYSATTRCSDNSQPPSDAGDDNLKTGQGLKVELKRDSTASYSKQEFENRTKLDKLEKELERMRKDKNIITGLVTQLQMEVSSKDCSLSKLTREMETLKKDSWKKDTDLKQLTNKLSKVKGTAKTVEVGEAREKEILKLRNSLMLLEKDMEDKKSLVKSQESELVALKQLVSDQREEKQQTSVEMEKVRSELEDLQRSERMVRIDLEQTSKKSQESELVALKQLVSDQIEEKQQTSVEMEKVRSELEDLQRSERMVRIDLEQTSKKSQESELVALKQLVSDQIEEKQQTSVEMEKVRSELEDLQRSERMVRIDLEQTSKKSQESELVALKQLVSDQREEKQQTSVEMEKVRSELEDLQRSERMVRIDLEQTSKKLECFRSRVVQSIFSVSGCEIPKKVVSDDEMVDMLKKMALAENNFNERLTKMKDKVNEVSKNKEELIKNIHKLRGGCQESLARLKKEGLRSPILSQEMKLLSSVNTEKCLIGLKNLFEEMIQLELDWEQKIEESLTKCGVNVAISTEEPGTHIEFLQKKWSLAVEENKQLKDRISKTEDLHKKEVEHLAETLQQEAKEKLKEAVEKAEQQGKVEVKKTVEEVKILETEKQENLLKNEQKKMEELNSTIVKLKELISSKDQETQDRLGEVNKVWSEIEELKVCKEQLELEKREERKRHESEVELLKADIDGSRSQFQVDISEYKEQLKQHSITICSLEERLQKSNRLNTEYSQTIQQLQNHLHEERTSIPPSSFLPHKPQIIVQNPPQDILGMETEIATLRGEMLQLKHVLQEKDGLIVNQRQDIIDAYSRLSDVAGELSEDNKEELEVNREYVRRHRQEMVNMREKYAALSQEIINKKDTISKLEGELELMKNTAIHKEKSNEDLSHEIRTLREFVKKKNESKVEPMNQDYWRFKQGCEIVMGGQISETDDDCFPKMSSSDLGFDWKTSDLSSYETEEVLLIPDESQYGRLSEDVTSNRNNNNISLSPSQHFIPEPCPMDRERSNHRDTVAALEASEESFFYVVKSLLDSLEIKGNLGMKSVANISTIERTQVIRKRREIGQQILDKISSFRQHLKRKQELLQHYEGDLSKLRKAEQTAKQKLLETDNLTKNMLLKTEEANLLRHTLHRTKLELQHEKRLNNAYKQKKTIHLENEKIRMASSLPGGYHSGSEPQILLKNRSGRKTSEKPISKGEKVMKHKRL